MVTSYGLWPTLGTLVPLRLMKAPPSPKGESHYSNRGFDSQLMTLDSQLTLCD